MSQIYPNLFLGNITASRDDKFIKKNGIKNVLIAGKHLKRSFPQTLRYKQLDISDNPTTIILKYWPESIEFITKCFQSGERVLVHCQGGKSRSASTVMAFVMFNENISAEQAIVKVRTLHKFAYPNPGFLKQLEYWEDVLKKYREEVPFKKSEEQYEKLQFFTSEKLGEVTKHIMKPWDGKTTRKYEVLFSSKEGNEGEDEYCEEDEYHNQEQEDKVENSSKQKGKDKDKLKSQKGEEEEQKQETEDTNR